jgi:hypothetical protein
MHSEEGPLTFRQDNGTVVFLQNDKTLQNYGIKEGSEIANFWEEEIPEALFDKENVRYETGAILQFRPTEDRPTFGLLLDTQEDQVRIRWVYEQKDVDKTLLQSLQTTYRIQLQDHELFLSNKLSLPINKDAFDSSAADIETGKKDGRSGHVQSGFPRRNASIRAPPSNVNFPRLNGSTAFSKIPKPRPSYPARGSPPPRGPAERHDAPITLRRDQDGSAA